MSASENSTFASKKKIVPKRTLQPSKNTKAKLTKPPQNKIEKEPNYSFSILVGKGLYNLITQLEKEVIQLMQSL